MKKTTKNLAELQAEKKTLEIDVKVLAARTDAAAKAELALKTARLEACEANIELAEGAELKAAALKAKAEAACKAMVASGELAAQDEARKTELMAKFTNPDTGEAFMEAYAIKRTSAALTGGGRTTANANSVALTGGGSARFDSIGIEAGAGYGYQLSSGWNHKEALGGYAKLMLANAACKWNPADHDSWQRKHDLSLEAANWYGDHLRDEVKKWEHIPGYQLGKVIGWELKAADYTDPNAATYSNLGTLTGTLVLQRTLPAFAYKFPEIFNLYTDFSDAPGMYNQTEMSRIISQPPVQTYVATLTNGRPGGWSTAVEGVATDASITLNKYVAVPIAIGNNIIAATTRKLFDEQAVLGIKAIAAYVMSLVTDLATAANYSYYATASGTLVPASGVYSTYGVTSQNFSMTDLDKLDAAFTSAKVPEDDRGLLLNPAFYAKLRGDSRLEFMYAASAKDIGGGAGQFLTEAKLPRLSGFAPYKAGYMPSSTPSTTPTTNNVVGFAFQKAGVMVKSRLPQDFSNALPTMVPGSITTVTDTDTGMSMMLVQRVDLQANFAEWRPEVLLGAAVGDSRAGLVLTGQ